MTTQNCASSLQTGLLRNRAGAGTQSCASRPAGWLRSSGLEAYAAPLSQAAATATTRQVTRQPRILCSPDDLQHRESLPCKYSRAAAPNTPDNLLPQPFTTPQAANTRHALQHHQMTDVRTLTCSALCAAAHCTATALHLNRKEQLIKKHSLPTSSLPPRAPHGALFSAMQRRPLAASTHLYTLRQTSSARALSPSARYSLCHGRQEQGSSAGSRPRVRRSGPGLCPARREEGGPDARAAHDGRLHRVLKLARVALQHLRGLLVERVLRVGVLRSPRPALRQSQARFSCRGVTRASTY